MTDPRTLGETDESLPAPDAGTFRRVMGRFLTGVTILTTNVGGHAHAMTANSLTSVSLDPLLVLACVEIETRFHEAIVESGVWGVSILPASGRSTAAWLATRGRPLHGQLDRVPHHEGPRTGVPLLDGALGTLECRTTAVHPGGDHDIVVAEVLSIQVPPACPPALTYFRGAYGAYAP